ncbi:pyridoxal phosphate-dependent decarboxylase family protein [Streptomyces sp. WI04-05B]|uniref:pyridoxal phosphate-dependent decarboxylase family protein n=1 Tax=Streptomyces TaxID=1883 RepID=UPI0029BA85F2|nr:MULTISPECIES: aminotransferase class I/II-fold pyridoxal phosphate-dependent enzyme [unclassified Streptomyces]MDX2547637.1 aminotransferase class I/II-fold pyridoxal phosphate-dependent enzyme [Streptomyces sp. WI04-05B]MDX2590107.1 aminotransferase class I/II-fold pyridoxal phosphate-dependent enzyme [Streptomyces sp. WI04-05A]MDX3752843.1 aminotransferase class I/II-fold pyridoxal phosphate-dependent enzyme [Streptomyces sp. AK08-02]
MNDPTEGDSHAGDWDPRIFEQNGREVLKVIRDHFELIHETPVTKPRGAAEITALLDADLPESGTDFSTILADTREKVIPNLVLWNHPSFFGYFPTSASYSGVLAETLTAALNVNAMLWKTSPAASALERVVLRWIAQLTGYPEAADGVLVNGASLATLYALTAARDAALDFDVRATGIAGTGAAVQRVYASDQAHSSVDKAAITLGIGLDNVVKVPSDARYRMRPDLLEEAIRSDIAAGLKPVAVVATVGTTSVASADPLEAVAAVCSRYGVWLHVDAAYGGFYALAPSLRGRLEDLSVGDSLVVNPQKTLFVPLEATALYCRRVGALANTFRLVPEYLTSEPDHDTVDYMDFSPQLGRSFRALKVWWVIRSFGRSGLAARLDHAVQLAEWLRKAADEHPDWTCVSSSVYPLVCLRYEPAGLLSDGTDDRTRRAELDALNARITDAVNADGRVYVSHSVIESGYIIRVSIGNIHTTRVDVEQLWDVIREVAERQSPPSRT